MAQVSSLDRFEPIARIRSRMLRIIIVGVAIAAALFAAKRDRWFERAGLVGNCHLTQPGYIGDTAQWWSCRQGLITGYPVLARQQCDSTGFVLNRELWRCTVPIETAPGAVF
jgi:hypothetical protein